MNDRDRQFALDWVAASRLHHGALVLRTARALRALRTVHHSRNHWIATSLLILRASQAEIAELKTDNELAKRSEARLTVMLANARRAPIGYMLARTRPDGITVFNRHQFADRATADAHAAADAHLGWRVIELHEATHDQ